MRLFRRMRGLRLALWKWMRSPRLDLKTKRQLRDVLLRERVRADRSGDCFSLVMVRFAEEDPDHRGIARLARFLRKRLRVTDDAGWYDDERIALVLPDTPHFGARVVAEDVRTAMRECNRDVAYELFLYPDRWNQVRPSGKGKDPTSHSEPSPVLSAEALFVRPLPWWKRGIDILGAMLGLVATAPLMAVAAVIMKLTSPGPVLFSQQRAGLGGKPFTIYKLRTMLTNADEMQASLRSLSEQDGPAFKIKHDPRVTSIGRFMRRTCIDELPQFWNVLKGDMSLVGPRPLPCDESEKCLGWQRRRLDVTPGLTCIWQVSGGMHVPFLEWMRMDIRYITRRHLWLDIVLLGRTLIAVLFQRASH